MSQTVCVLVPDSTVNPNSTVLINLSGPGGPTGRVNVNEALTLSDLGISADSGQGTKPTFPAAAIASINASSMTDTEKQEAIQAELDNFSELSEAFVETGSMTIEDKIIVGVVDWLVANKNFATSDKSDKYVINPDELVVTSLAPAPGVVLFSVTGSACWGH